MNRQTFVLYHRDADGFASAFAAWCALGDAPRYVSVQYNEPLPEIPDGSRVYILDFSWPFKRTPGEARAGLVELARRCSIGGGELTVLDHHAPMREELAGLAFCEFEEEMAGVDMAWDYFSRIENITDKAPAAELLCEPIPQPLAWIGYRDRWLHKTFDEATCADIEALNAYLELRGFLREIYDPAAPLETAERRPDFEKWHDLATATGCDNWGHVLETGHACLEYERAQVDRLCACASLEDMDAGGRVYQIPVVNSPLWASQIGHRLLELHPEAPFAMTYFVKLENGAAPAVVHSLRSRSGSGVDVAAIAKNFGGGGHKHAAGFTLNDFMGK